MYHKHMQKYLQPLCLSSLSLPHSHLNIRMMAVQYRSLPIIDILGCPLFFLFPFRYDLLVLQIVPFLNRCCSGSIPIILCGMVSFISRVSLNASCALIFMPYRYVIKNEEDPILSTLLQHHFLQSFPCNINMCPYRLLFCWKSYGKDRCIIPSIRN